ncbi:MAG: glycogen synthase GlgA [Verrucomicrobiales bacterium]|nr:glycogen synthase GlgA [Verrucomicrobiales bacterium]
MRVLIASSEVYPYSKTGGLADMVGGLAKWLARSGNQVTVVTPLYGGIRERFPEMTLWHREISLLLGRATIWARIWILEPEPNLRVCFVDSEFYEGREPYQNAGVDYSDNAERFIFFSKAVAYLARHLQPEPEIVHLHDWQTGVAALIIWHQRWREGWTSAPKVCFTIHNLAYQGLFDPGKFALTNLPWDYFSPDGVEFYGQLNCLKAGIVYADVITTVSPRYAYEITTPEFGCGLEGVLRKRIDDLIGVLNGVDYEEWDPERDPFIEHRFSIRNLRGKAAQKSALQRELGLPVSSATPLFGIVTRLAAQKGLDILVGALAEVLPAAQMQFVLVGTGSVSLYNAFARLAVSFPDKVSANHRFDQGLSHRVIAGCDFFIVPSQFEPCGLNQMYAQRYGTIPIVRRTGGLDDTVVDARENADGATGIKFSEYSARALAKAIAKALALYKDKPLLRHYRKNAMAADFSWQRTVREYETVYQRLLFARDQIPL